MSMIVFVVLHYNVYEETITCVNSLLRLNGEKRILVVDNGSPNKSGTILRDKYSNNQLVDVIVSEENLGFAKGNNLGYRKAKELAPDFIIVMNNDMEIVDKDFINGIYRCYDEYHFNIMAPDVYSTRKAIHQNPPKIKEYTLDELKKIKSQIEFKLKCKWLLRVKSLLPRKKEKSFDSTFIDVVTENVPLHGSFYVFDQIFIKKNEECFYNKTFMYMESQILYYLAKKNGYKLVYDPRIQVLHHEDVATDASFSSRYKKAIFTNQCLLISANAYIALLESERDC